MKDAATPPIRASYHHGDLRRAILEAALGLVARKGVEAFSLREAAREVGVSPAAAYRHFEDKAALLEALANEGMARLVMAMEKAIARAPGAPGSAARAAAELAAVGRAYVEFAVAHASHFRVMFGPWCEHSGFPGVGRGGSLGELPPEATPLGRDAYQILVDSLDGLVRSGAVAPAAREGAEIVAWSSVHGLASLVVEGALHLSAEERSTALDLILRTLLLGRGGSEELVAPAARGKRRLDPDPRARPECAPGRRRR